jgi:ribosome biogenesis protein BRX1
MQTFDSEPHLQIYKELLTDAFGVPRNHPKSKPFIDHMFCFYFVDNRIWFRHFQVHPFDHQLFRDTKLDKQLDQVELVEIGPRFSLQPIKIFKGFMAGEVIYSNQFYVPPIQRKKNLREALAKKYLEKQASKQRKSVGKAYVQPSDELDTVFDQIDKFEKGEIDNLNGEPDADFQMDEE